jgi:hypothetical protein
MLIAACCNGAQALASSAPAGAQSAFDCKTQPREKKLAGGAEYEHSYNEEQEPGVRFYICSFAGGGPYEIGGEIDTEVFTHEKLMFAGEQAALIADGSLEVVNLTKDKVAFQHALAIDKKTQAPNVGRIVLDKQGSLAWTEQLSSGAYEVLEHTAAGTKVLDDTKTTRPYSLKLKGSTLSWLEHNGESRTASLD